MAAGCSRSRCGTTGRRCYALLLDFGFDPDERVSSGEGDWVAYSQGYPLWHCAALGRREMAEMLLQRGANPNVHVDSSGSSVYSAYSHKQWDMVELLRRHGGVVSADTAAIYRQTDLARQMLADEARGAPDGSFTGKPVAEELLRLRGERRRSGDRAHGSGTYRLAARRLAVVPDADGAAHPSGTTFPGCMREIASSIARTYLSCFRLILERCDPNLIGGFGRTVLHEVAAMGEHVTEEEAAAFATALLDAGARMDVRDEILKSTPLGWACRWGRASVAKAAAGAGRRSGGSGCRAMGAPTRVGGKDGTRQRSHRIAGARCLIPSLKNLPQRLFEFRRLSRESEIGRVRAIDRALAIVTQ